MTPIPRPRFARRTAGFTLVEVSMALVVFLMMTLVFAAIFPIAVRGSKMSDNYAQAAQIAQHKLDQMRAAGFAKLNYAGLTSSGIIDTMSSPPATLPATYRFENIDSLVSDGTNGGYFPPGSSGTITVQDYATYAAAKGVVGGLPPVGAVDYVTVTITWVGGGVPSGTYSASAMIIQMRPT